MKQIDFGSGSIAKNILKTALPMLVAQVLSLLYSIVDRIYIGRIPQTGTIALGAVGLCFPVIIIIAGFTNMFGLGGSPLFSMERGRSNHEKAGQIINTSFRLLILTAVIITIAGEALAPLLLRLFGATETEMAFSLPYIRIYLVGTLFIMVSTGMNPFINAQGYPVLGMVTVAIGAVANLILDPLFIFTMGLGVSGAAIATVISQGLSAVYVMRVLHGKRNKYPVRFMDGGRITLPHAGEIVGLGMAPFIMQCTNSLVQIACNSVLMHFGGGIYVSVMTIVSSVRQILDTPVMAVTEGASPLISFNYGAKIPGNVRKAILIMTSIAVSYTLVIWILIEMVPEFFISIFTSDSAILADAVPALHIYFFAFIFQSFQYSGQTVFKALGKRKQTIFFSLFRKVVMVVPLTYIFPYLFHMGTSGVFLAEPVSNFIGGSACFITMLLTIMPELKKMEKGSVKKAQKGSAF